jgi:hypothetical protein
MLVNTIRKVGDDRECCYHDSSFFAQDLESDEVLRVCMALDNLIASPNEIVIPAVEARLHELLLHDRWVIINTFIL